MTNEEMAEEYASSATSDRGYYYEGLKEGFFDGLITGRPKWHKVADGDLPKYDVLGDSVSITVLNQNGNKVFYNFLEKVWKLEASNKISKVIAWCEIPKYTEK